jgi:hypothetical protein
MGVESICTGLEFDSTFSPDAVQICFCRDRIFASTSNCQIQQAWDSISSVMNGDMLGWRFWQMVLCCQDDSKAYYGFTTSVRIKAILLLIEQLTQGP